MKRIYLDYAAATPVDKRVVTAMAPYFSDVFYNPSALYEGAREARSALEAAREQTARLIGAKPAEIIFTAGGTESANLAINGVMSQYPKGNLVISSIEHDAVRKPAEKHDFRLTPVDKKGRVEVTKLAKLTDDDTVLISVILANNEIGTVQPIKEISKLVSNLRQSRKLRKITTPLYLHIDACQAPLYIDVNVARLGIDLMTLNGGKIHGPKQSGILYRKAGVVLEPVVRGGGQEWGMRSGTENVAFAVGFTRALEITDKGRAKRSKDMIKLRDEFMQTLESRFGAEITGHRTHRLANNVHAIFPGTDNERVLFALDDAGVDAAAGSACSASEASASHVLLAIGKSPEDSSSSIRFSLGNNTTSEELDKVAEKLQSALRA